MCGIFGFLGYIPEQLASSCIDTLSHRGPDGRGLWHQKDITLGHRRLAILDLTNQASQPMSYGNDRYWITFNGEIYNFLELREELEAKGYSFKSQSDTEVILAAFMEWKEECLNRFNGMWAFAIWDDHEKKLFLSRDRFGKKPLFYAFLKKGFAFASEMKAFFPLMDAIVPDQRIVKSSHLIFKYENTDECIIEGIKRFPAGHYGWFKNGELKSTRWWCTLDHLPNVPTQYEDQVEQFRELFMDACRLRMRSDVPIGTALSGGLDSSAVISSVAYLAKNNSTGRMSSSWQHAFIAAFPGTPLDETVYARQVTDHIGIQATFVEIDPLKAIPQLEKYFYLFEDLYITSPIPFMLTYGAVKSHGISVTLDGHGADELFGGYSFDYLIALEDVGFNIAQAFQIINTYYEGWPKGSDQFALLSSKTRFWLEWHLKSWMRKLRSRKLQIESKDNQHPKWGDLDHLTRQLYQSTHDTILPTLLRNYDRYSMANSVEIRMPFMDHRIVSFAFALPWSSKIRNGFSKAVVRDAVAPYMPHAIAYRKTKIGFNSPVIDWMKGPLREYLLDMIQSRDFKECSLIDASNVSSKLQKVIEDQNAKFYEGEAAWTLMMPYLWEKSLIKGWKKFL